MIQKNMLPISSLPDKIKLAENYNSVSLHFIIALKQLPVI